MDCAEEFVCQNLFSNHCFWNKQNLSVQHSHLLKQQVCPRSFSDGGKGFGTPGKGAFVAGTPFSAVRPFLDQKSGACKHTAFQIYLMFFVIVI